MLFGVCNGSDSSLVRCHLMEIVVVVLIPFVCFFVFDVFLCLLFYFIIDGARRWLTLHSHTRPNNINIYGETNHISYITLTHPETDRNHNNNNSDSNKCRNRTRTDSLVLSALFRMHTQTQALNSNAQLTQEMSKKKANEWKKKNSQWKTIIDFDYSVLLLCAFCFYTRNFIWFAIVCVSFGSF